MKKVFKFLAAALAIVAAASCAKENSDNNTTRTPDQELVHKVFSASLNVDSDTKTTLHTDGVSVHWTEDDKIRIAPENTVLWSGDLHATAIDETFAVFDGEVVEADKYWAVYPAGAVNTTNSFGGVWGWKTDKSTIVISNDSGALATQYAVDNNFSIAGAFNASSNFAVSVSYDADNPTALSFKNINAYLKVNLAMDNASKIELSSDAVSLVPSGSGELTTTSGSELGGPIVLNFDSKTAMDAGRNGIPHVGIYNSTEIITFAYENGENLKSGVNYYIAIPAVKIEGLKLVVKDANGKVLQTMTKKSTFTAEPNKIYNLGVIEEAKVEPAKVGDYFYSDGTYSTALDNSNSKTVVGVVFYVGDPTADDSTLKKDYPNCTNGLVVGLTEYNSTLGQFGYMGVYNWLVDNGHETPNTSDINGYGLTKGMTAYRTANPSYVELYDTTNGPLAQHNVSVSSGVSSWYIPSYAELKHIHSNKTAINTAIVKAGGTQVTGSMYWSSTLRTYNSYNDCQGSPFDMINGGWYSYDKKTTPYPVRVVFAF